MKQYQAISIALASIMTLSQLDVVTLADGNLGATEVAVLETAEALATASILQVDKIGQTDTSIEICWNELDNVASYSVICNGDVAAEGLAETSYILSDLESAGEYFVVVNAYDENGDVLYVSNELCAYTNLTLSSNTTLTQDLFVSDLFVDYGTLDLNGYNVYVNGDVWLSRNNGSSTLNINKGKLYINGDLNLSGTSKNYSSSCLAMQNDEDYIFIGGDMFVYSTYNSVLTAGTIELQGDFTQKYYNSRRNIKDSYMVFEA